MAARAVGAVGAVGAVARGKKTGKVWTMCAITQLEILRARPTWETEGGTEHGRREERDLEANKGPRKRKSKWCPTAQEKVDFANLPFSRFSD